MILRVYIYCLSTRKKTGDAKWFKVPASDLVIGDLCLPDGGGWSGCRHWTKTVVYMSHDTKNTRKSSLTGLQPICIIHPYHPWYIYNYLYIYMLYFSPENLQSWDSHDFISPEPLRCLCIGVLNPWINGKPFDVFRHLDVAVFVSSNVTLRLMRSHVPKAIPAQKCQIKNWACWSTPEIKKRLPADLQCWDSSNCASAEPFLWSVGVLNNTDLF